MSSVDVFINMLASAIAVRCRTRELGLYSYTAKWRWLKEGSDMWLFVWRENTDTVNSQMRIFCPGFGSLEHKFIRHWHSFDILLEII